MSDDEEAISAQQLEPCEICGENEFYSQQGFYYCQNCHFQSQEARSFADDVSFRTDSSFRRVLRADTSSCSSVIESESSLVQLTSWEIYNFVLNTFTNRLIGVGFPEILRDRVFMIWTRYLMRRQAILVSKTSLKYSKITVNEHRRNVWTLYNETPYGKDKLDKKREKRRKEKKEEKKAKKEAEILNNPTYFSLSQQKRRDNMERKKAHAQEYLAHASSMIEDDLAYESFSQPSSPPQVKKKKKKLYFTDLTKIVQKSLQDYGNIQPFPITKVSSKKMELVKAARILAIERFSFRHVYIILFVALRQIGFNVVYSDIKQLIMDGTLYIRSIESLFSSSEQAKCNWNFVNMTVLPYDSFYSLHCHIEDFINYVQVKFRFPRMESLFSKYFQELALPEEFSRLVEGIEKLIPLEELLKDVPLLNPYPCLIEIWNLSYILTILKLLFGLDGVTEYYQSAFAKNLNMMIAKSKKENYNWKEQPTDDIELFDIQDWLAYTRYKKRILNNEITFVALFDPTAKMNTTKVHHLIQSIGNKNYVNTGPKKDVSHPCQTNQRKSCDTLCSMFQEINKEKFGTWENPNYHTAPLPCENIMNAFLAGRSKAHFPNMRPEFLRKKFQFQRMDFIVNPGKYLPLIAAVGYKLRVIKGDAINYKKLLKRAEQPNVLLLFQPYKSFDDSLVMTESTTLSFLIQHCVSIINGVDKRNSEIIYNLIQSQIRQISKVFVKRCLNETVPLIDANLDKMKDFFLTNPVTERQMKMRTKRETVKREQLLKEQMREENKERKRIEKKKEKRKRKTLTNQDKCKVEVKRKKSRNL